MKEKKFTVDEFRKWLETMDSYGDIFYYLSEESIEEANKPVEIQEEEK